MKASSVIAAIVLAFAVAATVGLVYINMPKLPTASMIVKAVNETKEYSYQTNITAYTSASGPVKQISVGGLKNGVYYVKWTANGRPLAEWILYNGSFYANESGGGFMKISLSKQDLKRVSSSMTLAYMVENLLKNSTIVYKGKHGNGFIIKARAEYNRTIQVHTALTNKVRVHVVQNVTMILDSAYRPTEINMTVLSEQNNSSAFTVIVTHIKYSNVVLPSWVTEALKTAGVKIKG